jgi:hypothetical protein
VLLIILEGRKEIKDAVERTALSSSSWGQLVSGEITSMKWMAGGVHVPDNGQA